VWRRTEHGAELRDIVEVLHGIGIALMGISARLDRIIGLLGGDDDEEADA
jgi:hypothetical protein